MQETFEQEGEEIGKCIELPVETYVLLAEFDTIFERFAAGLRTFFSEAAPSVAAAGVVGFFVVIMSIFWHTICKIASKVTSFTIKMSKNTVKYT